MQTNEITFQSKQVQSIEQPRIHRIMPASVYPLNFYTTVPTTYKIISVVIISEYTLKQKHLIEHIKNKQFSN